MVPENEISLLEQDQSSGNQVKQQVISSSSGKKVVQICRVRTIWSEAGLPRLHNLQAKRRLSFRISLTGIERPRNR